MHTVYMTHKKKPISNNYFMGDSVLQDAKHHPYLGVELSNDLSRAKHITETVNSANKVLGLLQTCGTVHHPKRKLPTRPVFD